MSDRHGRSRGSAPSDPWRLGYEGFDPADEGVREVLCAVGNGYLVSRAAAPESHADGVHYPGTYLAGCYDRTISVVGGRTVENEDLVNCPNWLPLTFRPEGGDWFTGPAASESLELDLRAGVLTRRALVVDGHGRRTRLTQRRIASQAQPHLLALETELVPENWSGRLEVRSALDGDVSNTGVARYRGLNGRHLVPDGQGVDADGTLWLRTAATGSPLRIALAARTRPHRAGVPLPSTRGDRIQDGSATQILVLEAVQGSPVTVEKTVAVYTSRDVAIGAPLRAARTLVRQAPGFGDLARDHALRWTELWRRCRIDADFDGIGTVRLHLFHLLQTYSEHSVDLDVGIPARGLHGEAYRGHVFWDELFVLQLLNLRFPELARAVLRYRHRRLDAARQAARAVGLRGAMYPWQSASDGREESQQLHLNPLSGRWLPDHSHLQRHVGSAVAYNVWQHYQATGDLDFLAGTGAETLLEIARFWSSSAVYDPHRQRYSIRGVLGPDEYHDAYPWSDRPGLDDNAYTNVLAAWVLARALDAVEVLPDYRRDELLERLGLGQGELDRWQEVSRRLRVPFHDGVLSQFDGYERLAELDWTAYRRRYPDLRRLDRILEAEGDTVNRYKASKQADVLMLFYLFSAHEVRGLLRRLGYPAGHELFRRTTDHYLRRTVHGSTLSAVVHAWVLTRSDRRASWRFFRDALDGDLTDVQGGTTAEGIHLGAMAGTVDLLQRCYTGLEIRQDTIWLDPRLPSAIGRVDLDLRYRGHWGIALSVDRRSVQVSLRESLQEPVRVGFRGSSTIVRPGGSHRFSL
ncbi:family 65 glycosyl hydrolase [Kitasatospora herbaricolor]|uniref:glycoside hydrolase family 65 protein n=1 Tax=Kitasatospora herbaricolor TaxID=68217 RepID=UPI00174AD0C3|nr:glycoside hydrolase family 65 protein [Kitasatospora herbaricolor]MDQ0312713.1 trehalose/maltose hydrolase-like predicted phosphorylase [Kitasatospora herbaricolor]GGV35287.1 family 65 glycosyl hydrolase [Kitasatospora herbaricolor]